MSQYHTCFTFFTDNNLSCAPCVRYGACWQYWICIIIDYRACLLYFQLSHYCTRCISLLTSNLSIHASISTSLQNLVQFLYHAFFSFFFFSLQYPALAIPLFLLGIFIYPTYLLTYSDFSISALILFCM